MILYQLGCGDGHRFDSWFRDSAAFDDQIARGFLACPICGSCDVAKSIMAPAVVSASAKVAEVGRMNGSPDAPADSGALLDSRQQAVRAAMRAIRSRILAEGQDVGARFPEEVRSMHEGALPVRPVYGHATPDEAKGLIEDGIMILPIPQVPEELN